MNTQENNKLIAEFMGLPVIAMTRENYNNLSELDKKFCNGKLPENLAYHTSWDWLMPVHKKCMFTKQFTGDDQLRTLLIDAVIDADIDRLHKAVVEFINQYNN